LGEEAAGAMARLNYETADTLVYDPVAAHRTATRAVLYTLGFRNIETVGTVDAFSEAIRKRPPDLALCEARGADAELCEMIQSLRQGTGGHDNPFLVVIVTAWEKTNAMVNRVLNSGADDLLLRPFSTATLRSRIDMLTERRKRFVITHDYVGPDRRNDPSQESRTELFEPPNSLKMKAKDGLNTVEVGARLGQELRSAKDVLHSEKLRRDAFQIGILWRLLQEPDDPGQAHNLAKLAKMTQAVARRSRDTECEVAAQWCESVQAAVEGLEFGIDKNASMHLLGHAALNLLQALEPGKTAEAHLHTIESTVAMIRARNQSQAVPEQAVVTG
jgi:DNA-binding response OmpR family regulator